MTEEQRKEMISREFFRILAHAHGFKVIEPAMDHGVDIIVCPVSERTEPSGRVRYLDSPYKLDFQLKSTTINGVSDEAENIRFDLEAKNFNDLSCAKKRYSPASYGACCFKQRATNLC